MSLHDLYVAMMLFSLAMFLLGFYAGRRSRLYDRPRRITRRDIVEMPVEDFRRLTDG